MKTLYILILVVASSFCAEAKTFRYNISITVEKPNLNFTTNPFLDQDGLPKFSAIKASDLSPAIHHLVEKLEQDCPCPYSPSKDESETQGQSITY